MDGMGVVDFSFSRAVGFARVIMLNDSTILLNNLVLLYGE